MNISPETKRKMTQYMINITHPRMIQAIEEGYDHTDINELKKFMKSYEERMKKNG